MYHEFWKERAVVASPNFTITPMQPLDFGGH